MEAVRDACPFLSDLGLSGLAHQAVNDWGSPKLSDSSWLRPSRDVVQGKRLLRTHSLVSKLQRLTILSEVFIPVFW